MEQQHLLQGLTQVETAWHATGSVVTHVITTFPNEQGCKRVEHSNYDSIGRGKAVAVGEEKPGRKKRKERKTTSAAHHPPPTRQPGHQVVYPTQQRQR
jgi:hypothetical protein